MVDVIRVRIGSATLDAMQDALPIVIVVVVVLAAALAVVLARGEGRAYDHIGRGEMLFERDAPEARDDEIRQLLAARNARRVARGDAPQDVEAELRALTRPDSGLREEIRALVAARNARLIARGKPPLDVDAEVERRLADIDG
jgi:hypothetical protein